MKALTKPWDTKLPARLVVLLLLVTILSSCTSRRECQPPLPALPSRGNADKVDRSLITGDPCGAPCWQGIVPGESTTVENITSTLDNAPFVERTYTHQFDSNDSADVYWISSLSDQSDSAGHIFVTASGEVSYIFVKWLEYELTIQELIDSMGAPDWVYLISHDAFEGIGPPPPTCYETEVLWLDQGVRVMIPRLSEDQVSPDGRLVTPDTRVISVFYFPPAASLDEYLDYLGSSPASSRYYQEWNGLEAIVPQ